MNTSFSQLKDYFIKNLDAFYAASYVLGYSMLKIPYIVLLMKSGAFVKIEYSETNNIVNVYMSDNRVRILTESVTELAQFLMKINMKNTVGYWVVFPNIKRIAYKTTTKFSSSQIDESIVRELVLSAISSYCTNISQFSQYYEITNSNKSPAYIEFN